MKLHPTTMTTTDPWRPVVTCLLISLGMAATHANAASAQATDVDANDHAKPNVVLVMADDMGWAQTGYRDHPTLQTPNLDAMSQSGIRFERFYAGAPVCSPTRASVLTGRSNDRTGVRSHGYALRKQERTIAQVLGKAGYVCGHFGKWHLSGLRGPGVPILADNSHHPGHFGFDHWVSVTNYFDRDPLLSNEGKFVAHEGDSSEVVVDEALKFIERQVAVDQPFLAVVWYGSPHNPFHAAESDRKGFDELDRDSRHHYGELVAMDRSLGTLRAGLRRLNVADETLLWFCSDNGGLKPVKPSSVGPLRGHKGTIYEGGLLVPAVLEWPAKIPTPEVVDFRACTMDIFPTLCDVVGRREEVVSMPRDGISLLPLINKVAAGEAVGERPSPIFFRHEGKVAVIEGDLKLLIEDINEPVFELYDLKKDLAETENLLESRHDDAARLIKLLLDWNETVEASVAGLDYPLRRVAEGHPQRRFWTETPEYRPYFDRWRERPEYRRWIQKAEK